MGRGGCQWPQQSKAQQARTRTADFLTQMEGEVAGAPPSTTPVMELPMTAPSLGLAIRAQCVLRVRGPPENKLNYKRQARAQAASGRVLCTW